MTGETRRRLGDAARNVEFAEYWCGWGVQDFSLDYAKLALAALKGMRSRTATRLRDRARAVIKTVKR